jgi:hypothetical protein
MNALSAFSTRLVLQGTIFGDKVRITAQLIDAPAALMQESLHFRFCLSWRANFQ